MLESLLADVRFACRWLLRSPGFAIVAVSSLAIGIGFNTALFSLLDTLLFRPLPVVSPADLVDVYTSGPGAGTSERFGTTSFPDYADLRAQNAVFEDVLAYSPMIAPLNLGGRSRLALGEIVTGNYFRVLGVGAAIGRTLLPEDDRPGAPRVTLISHNYWTRELGGAADAVGRTLKLRGAVYTIVGVAPDWFFGMVPLLSPDMWVPASAANEVEPIGLHDVVPSPTGTNRLERRGERWLFIKGRLKRGATVPQAGANLSAIMSGLRTTYPATNRDRGIKVVATKDVRLHPTADAAITPIATGLMMVVGLVLLIACANVASMLLARASGRQKEIAIRLAIGASRGRLIRQLVTETFVLATLGACAGLMLAWWAARAVETISLPIVVPPAFELNLDARAFAFTLVATCAAALVSGLMPALNMSRPNLTARLRGEPVIVAVGGRWTMRDVLVAGQMAVTTLLLIVAALLTRSLIAAQKADVGFEVRRLAVVSVDTRMVRYDDERSRRFWDDATRRIAAIPGVDGVALTSRVPFSINLNRWEIWVPERHGAAEPGEIIDWTMVSPGYFATIGIPILQGRGFSEADRPDTPRVAVVNETMVRRFWPGQNAVGRTFRSRNASGERYEVVGVVADHKVSSVGERPTPFIHVARAQRPSPFACLIARTRGDAAVLLSDMRRELLAVEPDLVFVESQTMEDEVAATLFPVRAGAWLMSVVGLMAMLLAAIGLYGVIAYAVSRRTHEIGIRIALGADRVSVLTLVMRQGFVVASAGLLAGVLLAIAVVRAFSGVLYGIGAADPVSWLGAVTLLTIVACLANLVPAARAARITPTDALRTE